MAWRELPSSADTTNYLVYSLPGNTHPISYLGRAETLSKEPVYLGYADLCGRVHATTFRYFKCLSPGSLFNTAHVLVLGLYFPPIYLASAGPSG